MIEAASASKMSLTKRHTPQNSRGWIKTENYMAKELKQPYISSKQISLNPLFTNIYIRKFGLHLNRERKQLKLWFHLSVCQKKHSYQYFIVSPCILIHRIFYIN